MLAVYLRKSPLTEYMLHDSFGPGLVTAEKRVVKFEVPAQMYLILVLTSCSMTSFLETLSKYPSHIFLNRSRISFSTNSSSSLERAGKAPFTPLASLVASFDRFPGSVAVDNCLEVEAGGTIPKYGRE